ncbi:MAG: GtrA family protein [Leptonema sp. (in: bacteria)]
MKIPIKKNNLLTTNALQNKKILYLINGTIIFGINILLAYLIVRIPFSSNERIQNNISNAITTEFMVFISFFIHNRFTWKNNKEKLLKKIIKYHLVMMISILIRLFSFFVFDFLNFPFLVSTVLSIAIIVLFNFFGFDRFVFIVSK